jgi:hypothetical protein
MLATTKSYVELVDNELEIAKKSSSYYTACDKRCDVCGVSLCCHYENQACSENKKT